MSSTARNGRTLIVDIETGTDVNDEWYARKAAKIKAPSTWKDPVKIKRNKEEKMAKLLEKAALSPLSGKVVCVGLGMEQEDGGWDVGCFVDRVGEEAQLLHDVDVAINKILPVGYIVTFGGRKFDFPFLTARSMIHGLKLGFPWPVGYDHSHIDMFDQLGEGSLEDWSILCGEGKKQHHGGEIAELIEKEDWDSIILHCTEDILKTAALFDRYRTVAKLNRG